MDAEQFVLWVDEHYELDPGRDRTTCRRCGQRVTYLTKHAAVRHGDPIDVLPVRRPELAGEW